MWEWIKDNAIELVGLASTLALLCVTGSYTKATKAMADTARAAAAESARATEAAFSAAEAAREATHIAQSQIIPKFEAVGRNTQVGPIDWASIIVLRSKGDPVVVQKVTINRALPRLTSADEIPSPELVGEELVPFGDTRLPWRLQGDDALHFSHSDVTFEYDEDQNRFSGMFLDVHYTFSKGGQRGDVFPVEVQMGYGIY